MKKKYDFKYIMTFQKNVLRVAFVLLIITSIIVFIMLYLSKNQYDFPPNVSRCPDYWIITPPASGSSFSTCRNKAGLSSGAGYTFKGESNRSYEPASGEELCALKKSLNSGKIVWTGISNNPQICNYTEDID